MKTEQIIEEREDSVKMKMRFKRFLSGFMAVATLASVIIQPVAVSASELEPEEIPFEQQYAELKDVQDSLDPNEIVKANDIELSYGQEFDVEVDLSGIEGVDESKIKILFHEAKNEAGTDFDTHTPDTYKAVYAVEPVSGHPAYRVSRNITVKEPKTEAITTSNSSENTTGEGNAGEMEDIGTADDEETDRQTETEVVTDLTEESETTTDEETGLTVSDVMEQADEERIDLYSLDEGESVTFMARVASTTSTKKVTVTRGACYQYSDYGYGSYLTYQYTVKFGSVSATAYCIQPEKSSPGSGTYDITKLSDGKKLAKVCYYGTKASGDDGFFTEENGYGNLSTGARFILVHLAADGSVISAAEGYKPSSEMKMHFRCYAERDDVKAVVHAHPPVATSYASMGRALDGYQTMENIVNLGAVPVAPYAQPSTDEVPDSIAPFLQEHDAILLAHHGALTVGESLTRAYFRMESLEMFAKTSLYIHLLGGAPDMPEDKINALMDLRQNGYKIPGRHPGYVKYNKPEEK